MSQSPADVRPGSEFRLGRVLWVVVPCAVAVAVGLPVWGYFDVSTRISRWMLPPLVPATGQVYLNGEPAGKAEVFTQPIGMNCRGAMGMADEDGRFSLRTDVDGDWVPGARAGEHRVIILKQDPQAKPGPFKPPLISPPECAEFDTTPLRMRVERDPARNQFPFHLEHQARASTAADAPDR
jgi:hypothetical protein